MCSSCSADDHAKQMPDSACDGDNAACNEIEYKLVSITVKANATQNGVTGNKNWVAVKKDADEIIVEAVTSPDNIQGWQKINWWGDKGDEVPGKPNQRKLSRSESKTLEIEADLGGVNDKLSIWVVWAEITIHTSGTTPKNSKQFSAVTFAEKENLGAVINNSFGLESARGKVALVAQITPAGINQVAASGWAFKRERISRDWVDGAKRDVGNGVKNYWNTQWVDDTSKPEATMLTPTNDPASKSVDQIFDIDGPDTAWGSKDSETYNNFRQWIEWNNEKCSDYALWYWKASWQNAYTPKITLKEVGTGNITLPDESPIHAGKPKPVK